MDKQYYKNISIDSNNVIWKLLDLVNMNYLEKNMITKKYIDIFHISKQLNYINKKKAKEKEKITLICNIETNGKYIYNLKQAKSIYNQINKKKQIGGGKHKSNSNLVTLILFPLWKIENTIPITTKLFDAISKTFQESKLISKTVSPLIESMLALANMGGNIDLIEKVLDEIIIIISIMYNFSRKHIVVASVDAFQHFPLMGDYINSLDYSIKNDIRELEKKYKKNADKNIERVSDLLDNILEIVVNVEDSLGKPYQDYKEEKLETKISDN